MKTSVILNEQEITALYDMTQFANATLRYRASRDGFTHTQFHKLCGGLSNSLTILQSNNNYVFGGFTKANWNITNGYQSDFHSFIFSVRRNGTFNNVLLRSGGTYDQSSEYSIWSGASYGPIFGGGHDLLIYDNSFSTKGYSNLCHSYDCPVGCSYGTTCAQSYLVGSMTSWYIDEMECFEMQDAYLEDTSG